MSAKTSPSLTVKFTLSTARNVPNDFTRFRVTSTSTSASPPARPQAFEGPHESRRERQDEHDEHDAEQELPVHRVADGERLEVVEHHGPDDRPRERSKAAEDRHED